MHYFLSYILIRFCSASVISLYKYLFLYISVRAMISKHVIPNDCFTVIVVHLTIKYLQLKDLKPNAI